MGKRLGYAALTLGAIGLIAALGFSYLHGAAERGFTNGKLEAADYWSKKPAILSAGIGFDNMRRASVTCGLLPEQGTSAADSYMRTTVPKARRRAIRGIPDRAAVDYSSRTGVGADGRAACARKSGHRPTDFASFPQCRVAAPVY